MINTTTIYGKHVRTKPRHVRYAALQRLGYTDRITGRGFPAAYDTWIEVEQKNYEVGRLKASNLMLAGLPTPAWRPGVFRPQGFDRLVNLAADRVGSYDPKPDRAAIAAAHQPEAVPLTVY